MPSENGTSVITTKLKSKYILHSPHIYFYIFHKQTDSEVSAGREKH